MKSIKIIKHSSEKFIKKLEKKIKKFEKKYKILSSDLEQLMRNNKKFETVETLEWWIDWNILKKLKEELNNDI